MENGVEGGSDGRHEAPGVTQFSQIKDPPRGQCSIRLDAAAWRVCRSVRLRSLTTMKRLCATAWTLGVLLVMDDAAASDVDGMPTMQQLAREGATFDHAYAPSPMCAPGRAVIQTGLYSQNNGVTQNSFQQFVDHGDLTRTF